MSRGRTICYLTINVQRKDICYLTINEQEEPFVT